MDKTDHLMAEKNKIIKTAKRGKSHQKKIFKKRKELPWPDFKEFISWLKSLY
jgi:hypothetical protein